MDNQTIQKYLKNYAEAESKQFQYFSENYDYVIVIPACDEDKDFLRSVFSLIRDNCLVVLVVNSPIGHNQWQVNNHCLIKYLTNTTSSGFSVSDNIKLLKYKDFFDVLLVDRNSEGLQLNPKQGVGLARKIGADSVLALFSQGLIKYPWIFSTDADVILPHNYFTQIKAIKNNHSAVVLDFKHITEDLKLAELQYLYDFKMRYYLAGIEYAMVGYAYIPLGSTLIVSMLAYAQVRGFPKRNAGEDFYLLNKLEKVKPIKYKVDDCAVQIRSRFSDRVPFGTGPAIKQIDDLEDINHYSYYNPQCFIYLKLWNEFLNQLWTERGLLLIEPKDSRLLQLYNHLDCHTVFTKSHKQITSIYRWQQFIHQWFDAFRILKTVHFFDKKFERLNYKRLLKDDSFVKVTNPKLNLFIFTHDTI